MNEFENGVSFEIGGFAPRVDITEDDTNLYVHAEIPGMTKENVNLVVNEDRMLTIKGEKKSESKTENKSFIRNERSYGSFSRSFILPENVDIEKIAAKFEHGVLEVSMPKKEPEKPKQIEVQIH